MTAPDPRSAALETEVQQLLGDAVANGITPSAVCSVVLHGQPLHTISAGPATAGTYFDLASVTKVFTAVTALSLVDSGALALDEPISTWLPSFRSGHGNGGKSTVTLRHLLTHTSGLPAVWPGWRSALATGTAFNRQDLLADLLSMELTAVPGSHFDYSCVGFNTVMALAEHVTGRPWAGLVREQVLEKLCNGGCPSGLVELTGRPDPELCAPTEFQPEYGRGLIQGLVHDESAWSLGGLSGNAGLFGTAPSLAAFGEDLLAGLPGILSPTMAAEMWQDQLPLVLGGNAESGGPGYGHGLGLRIGQESWMGAHPGARGHNGFTGTSLLVDREAGIAAALLTNRVHPSRTLSNVTALRHAVADVVYAAA
ncbi:serine hydrolase domain-containing protein [Arthrobacter alpinus]|uniref:serine hydrolase domain-containing protein n=1 Tax=Arthrobacter alpinus TaxID=656366 RepID=UPI0009F98D94|nr:serine hydrolase domain-containing protein [Arthrobacter alpinus]